MAASEFQYRAPIDESTSEYWLTDGLSPFKVDVSLQLFGSFSGEVGVDGGKSKKRKVVDGFPSE